MLFLRTMIPKKIHYCWLSGDPYPELIAQCIAGWKDKLPDYEFVLWDANRFDIAGNEWVRQAFETKKYAFAADYIRLFAIYTEGGIYLDTDVEVVKAFDDLLHLPYFVGSEGNGIIEAGVFGAEARQSWIKDCLDYYIDKPFIKPDGSLDTLTLPRIMMQQIGLHREIVEVSKPTLLSQANPRSNQLLMLPQDFFCAKNHGSGMITKTDNTYSIHHFAMSWHPKRYTFLPNLKRKLMGIFGVGVVNTVISVLGLRKIRSILKG